MSSQQRAVPLGFGTRPETATEAGKSQRPDFGGTSTLAESPQVLKWWLLFWQRPPSESWGQLVTDSPEGSTPATQWPKDILFRGKKISNLALYKRKITIV